MSIELLEDRVAPAALVSGHVVTYTDSDGDHVTLTFSKGDTDANLINRLVFDAGQTQLQKIDLQGAIAFTGASITLHVTRASGGDGAAAVGYLNATGIDLGLISIQGDLAQIDCGTDGAKPALAGLKVASLGRFGTATEPAGNDLESDLLGAVGPVSIAGVVQGAYFNDAGGHAQIGKVTIGGAVLGSAAYGSGSIVSTGPIGKVKIGGDLQGGAGTNTGIIYSRTAGIAGVALGGSLIGGGATGAGQVVAAGDVGPVTVGGSVVGGSGEYAGSIASQNGNIASIVIGGSLRGSSADHSGQISAPAKIGIVTIGGNVEGGDGFETGFISAGGKLGGLSVGGSLLAGSSGSSQETGRVIAKSIGNVFIGGNLAGSHDSLSGLVEATGGSIGQVTVRGSIVGGTGSISGAILTDAGNLGFVKIGGDLSGNGANRSGAIDATGGDLAGAYVGGSLLGGVNGGGVISAEGSIGSVTVVKDVIGSGANSGWIVAEDRLASVTIGGDLTGGPGKSSGRVFTDGGNLGPVEVGGSVQGGAGSESGTIAESGGTGNLASVFIGGALSGGTGSLSGSIYGQNDVGKVTINGAVLGSIGEQSATISANSGTLGAVRIGGDLDGGYGTLSGSVFGHLSIKSVTIGGSLIGPATVASDVSNSANIGSTGSIGAIRIAGNFAGGNASGAYSSTDVAEIDAPNIDSIFIGGSIITGTNDSTGSVFNNTSLSARFIGSLTVLGSLVGHTSSKGDTPVQVVVENGIGPITIGGSVTHALIAAGYDSDFNPANATAKIGAVKVGGDWTASSLVAGVKNLGADDAAGGAGVNADNVSFGNEHDTLIAAPASSKIASIVIGGVVLGTASGVSATDFYGFSSHGIGSLKIDGQSLALPGAGAADLLSPSTGSDVAVRIT